MNKLIAIALFILTAQLAFAQGHIDHIKNQKYLKLAKGINCDSTEGVNISTRVCANLAYQKTDSILCIVYNELLHDQTGPGSDSTKRKIVALQDLWRTFRDQHCALVYDSWDPKGSDSSRGRAYLDCLRELTEDRIQELRRLIEQLQGN